MPTRDDIVYGIQAYSAEQLAEYLINGIVTVPEILLENPNEFSLMLRNEVERTLWSKAEAANSVRFYNIYLTNYPASDPTNHTATAHERIGQLQNPPLHPVPETPPVEFLQAEEAPEPPVMADPWDSLDKNSIEALEQFRESYPDHPRYIEAGQLINSLETQAYLPKGYEWLKMEVSRVGANDQADLITNAYKNKQITHEELVYLFWENHNFVNRNVVLQLLSNGIITTRDLQNAGIDDNFINVLRGSYVGLVTNKVDTTYMINPEAINMKSQEIYFWGIPASGKTCALGAILSAASSGIVANSLNPLSYCNGYAYMNQLRGTFQPGKISELPSGTNEDFVADMSFELIDQNRKSHAITLIDIAGELLDTMRRIDEQDFYNITEAAMKGYQCMINLLINNRSTNSKIHFFVVEYGGHNREHKGMYQADLLDAALTHIHARGVLKNSDAVYVLMTKADMALNQPGDINQVLENYLLTYYNGFYNRLKAMANENSIKRLGFIPFSIGEVCFKNLCRFDATTANNVVETFIEDTRGEKTGAAGRIFGGLRS